MTDYMVTGLVKKRAELAGELTATHNRLRALVNQLEALDVTLRIVAPDMEVEAIRPKAFRPPDDWSKRGQMSRLVLSILRQSKEPLTSREIAAQMLFERARWIRRTAYAACNDEARGYCATRPAR